jgi:hypothetical protein
LLLYFYPSILQPIKLFGDNFFFLGWCFVVSTRHCGWIATCVYLIIYFFSPLPSSPPPPPQFFLSIFEIEILCQLCGYFVFWTFLGHPTPLSKNDSASVRILFAATSTPINTYICLCIAWAFEFWSLDIWCLNHTFFKGEFGSLHIRDVRNIIVVEKEMGGGGGGGVRVHVIMFIKVSLCMFIQYFFTKSCYLLFCSLWFCFV